MRTTTLQISVQQKGEEVLQAPQRDSPAAHGAEHGEAVSLQPKKIHSGAKIH